MKDNGSPNFARTPRIPPRDLPMPPPEAIEEYDSMDVSKLMREAIESVIKSPYPSLAFKKTVLESAERSRLSLEFFGEDEAAAQYDFRPLSA